MSKRVSSPTPCRPTGSLLVVAVFTVAVEKELRRKEKALAEAAALLALQKKAQAIWGDGEDD